jgi:hypothetical protein
MHSPAKKLDYNTSPRSSRAGGIRGLRVKRPREAKRSSDEAVKAKTGKVWAEWFRILDKVGAKKLSHKEIWSLLSSKHKVPVWWAQMVAVGYEHERGMRAKFQNCAGDFSANSSRTFGAPVPSIYDAWTDEKLRHRWLPDAKIEITTATPGKSIRAKWDGDTRLSVYFYGAGSGKTRIAVDHMKLASSKDSVRMKSYWSNALDRLQKTLEA